ncbi:hypothetical protein BGX34_011474 [Mortierella sp. NVP85]|nr:hypothetical protein BGX34_011474 [Mortierella sp. NVP85]
MKVREDPLGDWVLYQDVVYGRHKCQSTEKAADEKVKTIKKAAQDHVGNAAEMAKVSSTAPESQPTEL